MGQVLVSGWVSFRGFGFSRWGCQWKLVRGSPVCWFCFARKHLWSSLALQVSLRDARQDLSDLGIPRIWCFQHIFYCIANVWVGYRFAPKVVAGAWRSEHSAGAVEPMTSDSTFLLFSLLKSWSMMWPTQCLLYPMTSHNHFQCDAMQCNEWFVNDSTWKWMQVEKYCCCLLEPSNGSISPFLPRDISG